MSNFSSKRHKWEIMGRSRRCYGAVETTDVLTANNNDKQTRPRLLLLGHFITCLPPEIPRDIAYIPSMMLGIVNFYKRVILLTFISAFFNSSSDFIKDSVSSLKEA